MFRIRHLLALAAVLVIAAPASTRADDVVAEWASVKAPSAPELKEVVLDPKTTAVLVMDFIKQTCSPRPRCIASLPKVRNLLAAARAKGVMLIYTLAAFPGVTIADTLPEVAPKGNEAVVVSFLDKFILGDKDTGLQQMLKDKGITTVIAIGTAANGAVLYTGSAAAGRGFNVIVPVDGMSGDGDNTYIEQYVAYNLVNAPVIKSKITLTRIDMIKF